MQIEKIKTALINNIFIDLNFLGRKYIKINIKGTNKIIGSGLPSIKDNILNPTNILGRYYLMVDIWCSP